MVLNKILICTDLDRTLLPNGLQTESAQARPLFRQLVEHPQVQLAYVSGRHKQLLLDAIEEYDLPVPDYAIADVGSSIYAIEDHHWRIWEKWHAELSLDWDDSHRAMLVEILDASSQIRQQEPAKQGKYKLSYYARADTDTPNLLQKITTLLHNRAIKANLIWSIDETTQTGLLDVLPPRANKLHAIHFLMAEQGFAAEQTVFAGDSGNDLEVLCSDLQATLVANASPEVRQRARQLAHENGSDAQLYIARGDFLGMNGNYAAGILEGVVHYLPDTLAWLKTRS